MSKESIRQRTVPCLTLSYIQASLTAKKTYTDSLQLTNGKFDVKSTNSQEIGMSIGKFSIGESKGAEHSFFDENCTCDLRTPFVKQAECGANRQFVKANSSIEISASFYLIIGFDVSLSINIDKFFDELIDIYNTSL